MKRLSLAASLLFLLLALAACGSAGETPDAESPKGNATAEDSNAESPVTLESLCGEEGLSYIIDTITMQMENRMEKTPDVVFFPISENAPLTDYAAIDETTAFEVDEDGNIIIFFPAGAVAEERHGEQSFKIPKP